MFQSAHLLLRAAPAALAFTTLLALPGCDPEDPQDRPAPIKRLSEFDPANRKLDSESKKNKNGKEADMSNEAVRNKALEAIKKNQEKTLEAFEKATVEDQHQKKKDSEKKKGDPSKEPQTFVKGNTPYLEIPKKLEKGQNSLTIPNSNTHSGKLAEVLGPNQKGSGVNGNSASVAGPNSKSGKDNANGDARVMNGTGSIGDGPPQKDSKPGLLERIFGGNDKPDRKIVKSGDSGTQFEILNDKAKTKKAEHVRAEKSDGTAFGAEAPGTKDELNKRFNPLSRNDAPDIRSFKPSSPDKHGMLSAMVAAEMAQGALANQASKKERKAEEGADAVVVPLDGAKSSVKRHPLTDFEPAPKKNTAASNSVTPIPTAAAPAAAGAGAGASASGATQAAAGTTTTPLSDFNGAALLQNDAPGKTPAATNAAGGKPAASKDDSQNQFGSLDDYRRGLDSRDFVARERAFQRAVAEKREDALPYLAEEIVRGGSLCEFAARCLAALGKRSDIVDRALIGGLITTSPRDTQMREACAVALGQLRVPQAVGPLQEKCKHDPSYPVRSACAASLGMLGDRAALPTLHMKLDDRGEIEFVKQSASLALARLGDSAGREHLISALESPIPAMQVLGVTGLVQLNDPDTPGLLISRLNSEYEEVWTTVLSLLPRMGAPLAVPMLRTQLITGNELMRLRAALALGYLGNSDGMAYICRAARGGSLQERVMGCELLGNLQRSDQIPLLLEKLDDTHSDVRQITAIALTRLKAVQAAPAIADAARGRLHNQQLPPALRGAQSDMNERVVMLACLRILRGEKDDLALYTLPAGRDQSWPEFERELLKQQVEMIKLYKLVEVIQSGVENGRGSGALLRAPGGQEIMYREKEVVAAGFRIVDINLGGKNKDSNAVVPPFVTLQRGNDSITLYVGQNAESTVETQTP